MGVIVWVGVVLWDVYSFLFVVGGVVVGVRVVWRHIPFLFPLFDIFAQDIFGRRLLFA